MAKGAPPPASTQCKRFLKLKSKNSIKPGTQAYLVSASWFLSWKSFVGLSDPARESPPPPINNGHLLLRGHLKPTLMDKYDFIVLSQPLWSLLYEWYGGGPELAVDIIAHPRTGNPIPILNRWTFTVWQGDTSRTLETDKYKSTDDLKNQIAALFDLNPTGIRIVDFWNRNYIRVLPPGLCLFELNLVDTQDLLVDTSTVKTRPHSPLIRTRSSQSIRGTLAPDRPRGNGRVGLDNLGNTCFFNASVQALAHCVLLRRYFGGEGWRRDVNHVNPLSTGGQLANAFAQLLNDIWKGSGGSLNPTKLHATIVAYAPQFGGGRQQDAQELLLFLLDGLHEDLNRVSAREYTEGVSGDGSDEDATADTAWKRHKLVNDSMIVNIFHGQLRTELRCPQCQSSRIVFDPYVSVTLPLPTERMVPVRYFFTPFERTAARVFGKLFVIVGMEIEQILVDIRQTRGAANPICIPRDVLIDNLQTRLAPKFRKVEYFVFDVPHADRLYTVVSLYLIVARRVGGLVGSPILIQAPHSRKGIHSRIDAEFGYLWQPCHVAQAGEQNREPQLADRADGLFKKRQRLIVEFNFPNVQQFVSSEIPGITTQSLKIIINPDFSRVSKGFNWSAILPIGPEPMRDISLKMDLDECLKCFAYPSNLDDENAWFCPTCRKAVNATATLRIWSVPDTLIFHLKRFVFRDGTFKKENARVGFPVQFNMSRYVVGPQKDEALNYKLFAVVHHTGSMGGGHYTATIETDQEAGWYSYNDSVVFPARDKFLFNETAYVLLYKRQDDDASAQPKLI